MIGSTQHETLLVVSSRSLHVNTTMRTLFVYTEFTKKKVFEKLTLTAVSSGRPHHGRHKVSITECDLTVRVEKRSTITLLSVMLHSGIKVARFFFDDSFTLSESIA